MTQVGIPAAYINSSLSDAQYQTVFRRATGGAYRILYVAPERLATADFRSLAVQAAVSLVAVDAAHCVSQWGQDFRPSYLKIAAFLDGLPRRPVVGAFTATATAEVSEDIVRLLQLRESEQDALRSAGLSQRHARALLALEELSLIHIFASRDELLSTTEHTIVQWETDDY